MRVTLEAPSTEERRRMTVESFEAAEPHLPGCRVAGTEVFA